VPLDVLPLVLPEAGVPAPFGVFALSPRADSAPGGLPGVEPVLGSVGVVPAPVPVLVVLVPVPVAGALAGTLALSPRDEVAPGGKLHARSGSGWDRRPARGGRNMT
jgi:hypothetical protein